MSSAMERWVTDFIDRYFVSEPTADSLRAIMLLAAVVQAVSVAAGFVLLWGAIDCGLSQHHGHAIVCTVGVVIGIVSFDIATNTRKRAQNCPPRDPLPMKQGIRVTRFPTQMSYSTSLTHPHQAGRAAPGGAPAWPSQARTGIEIFCGLDCGLVTRPNPETA